MKISAIKQQVKNPGRVSIFIDGKYEFSLSLDELVKYKLKNGDQMDKNGIKKFKKISQDGKLRMRAVEWLMNRPRSVREFRDYLYRKKAEPEFIEGLVSEMLKKGYLNDVKFAEWFVELQARRGKSDRAIRAELFKKGIDRETTDSIFQEDLLEKSEAARLAEVITKKRQLSRYRDNPEKLTRYLIGKGFSWHAVKSALGDKAPEEST